MRNDHRIVKGSSRGLFLVAAMNTAIALLVLGGALSTAAATCDPPGPPPRVGCVWSTDTCEWLCPICDPPGPPPREGCTWSLDTCEWICPICDPPGPPPRVTCSWSTETCEWICPICDPPGPPPQVGCTWSTYTCEWTCPCQEPDCPCPHACLDPTVILPPTCAPPPPPSTSLSCDSGVPNGPIPPSAAFPDGCTIEDEIVACGETSQSPGQYDKCVKTLLNELKKEHVITERQRKAIDTCLKKSKKRHVSVNARARGGAIDH